MLPPTLKMYFIGTALTVLAVLFGMVDSFGGLMYVQDEHYMTELGHTQRQLLSTNRQGRRAAVTKHIGS